jgi:hypothetical protein
MGSGVSGTVEIIVNGNRSVEMLPVSIWVNDGDSVSFCYQASVESLEGDSRYVLKEGNSSSTLTIDEPMIIHGYYLPESVSSGFGLEMYVIAVLLVSVPASVTVPVLVRRRRGGYKIIRPVVSNGGMISPNTEQKIDYGGDSTVFIIAADFGYKIEDVVIDKNDHLGAIRTHKFEHVTKNHTISAIFKKN